MKLGAGVSVMAALCLGLTFTCAAPAARQKHVFVAGDGRTFRAWPANNGAWIWGREIVVGFTYGDFEEKEGHNIRKPFRSGFARSLDGGETWKVEDPEGFLGDGKKTTESPGNIRFDHPDFAMRVFGSGYEADEEPKGAFYVSYDRAKTWQGPYGFGAMMDHPELKGLECTSRTDYIVAGPRECLFLQSARKPGAFGSDKTFLTRTTDGGKTFQFASWVVPPSDPNRAVMPATVRISPSLLVSSLRRRVPGQEKCWVDAYASRDNGRTWAFLSKIGDTGGQNGNPPALLKLKDGRLVAAYGNRDRRQMVARYSKDNGASWGDEVVLRDDYAPDKFGNSDLGYPRIVQRADGRLVFFYYWATKDRPQQHIAATILEP